MRFETLIEFTNKECDLNKGDIIEIIGFIGDSKEILIDKINDEKCNLPRAPYEFIINFCKKLDD